MKMLNNSNWKTAIIHASATMREVIANLNASGLQIVLVVDEEQKLLGTVTDGDIRRSLLLGVDLDSKAFDIMFAKPKTVSETLSREAARRKMIDGKIHQLPAIDAKGRVVGLHVWDQIIAAPQRPNTAVIMAGGMGKRLRPLTDNCPKPMLSLNGRPILEHIIERLRKDGFSRFVLSLHYLGDMIEDHFGDGSRFEVEISYVRESEPLGTAGALSLFETKFDEPFIVTNGDVITDISYAALLDAHIAEGAAASMAVRSHMIQNPFGVVKLDGNQITGFDEKPIYRSHINAGIYVLEPVALASMVTGEYCDMPTLFERLRANGKRVCAFPMYEEWLDLGHPNDLERAKGLDL